MTSSAKAKFPTFEALEGLFYEAKKMGLLGFLYILVRVSEVSNVPDPFRTLTELAKSKGTVSYKDLSEPIVLLEILQNLLNCSSSVQYQAIPFQILYKPTDHELIPPTIHDVAVYTEERFREVNKTLIADNIKIAYRFTNGSREKSEPNSAELRESISALRRLIVMVSNLYRKERRTFIDGQQYHKISNFIVLEPLVSKTDGIFGFKAHFSNGSNAYFERHPDRTEASNIISSSFTPIGYNFGDLSKLVPEWRVGNRRLYEIGGIPGRYNELGEWKPIVYPGETQQLQVDSKTLAEGDHEVEGVLFYMMCTGHCVVEFAVKTYIQLPLKGVKLGEKMHLWECPEQTSKDYVLYDGQYDLEKVDPESIKIAIASINVGLNRLAFAFDSVIQWSVKYNSHIQHPILKAHPSMKDLQIIDSLLKDFPTSEDSIALDISIDWYHKGELAMKSNVFLAFLSYYIAFEFIVIGIANGEIDLNLGFHPENSTERKKKVLEGIQTKYDLYYKDDPVKFISEAYFDDVVGLKRKARAIAEFVFGKEHKNIALLFENKKNKPSLSELRSKIAHGTITLLSRDDKVLIEENLPVLADIVAEFLKKIIFFGKEIPTWSRRYSSEIYMYDPRGTKVVTNLNMIENPKWTIRSEWIN